MNVLFTLTPAAAHVCRTQARRSLDLWMSERENAHTKQSEWTSQGKTDFSQWHHLAFVIEHHGFRVEETSLILKLISDAPKEQILWERKRWCSKLHQIVRLPHNDHWKSVLQTVGLLKFRPGSLLQLPDISPQAWLQSPLLIEAAVGGSGCFSFKLPVPRWVSDLRLGRGSVRK